MYEQINKTATFLNKHLGNPPKIVIVLGTGYNDLEKEFNIENSILYKDIPNFTSTTVQGHSGKLISAKIEDNHVWIMSGRFHYYEGYSMQQVTFPIRVFKALNIENIMFLNAAGGVNTDYNVGDIMLITDHINLLPEHPLRGKNLELFGKRFTDMSFAYDTSLINIAWNTAKEENIPIQKGVYLALQGPTFETPAEYDMVKKLGADAVGMSTVPEVIVARHQNMRCFAMSIIADMGGTSYKIPISHYEVINNVEKSLYNAFIIIKSIICYINYEQYKNNKIIN